MLKHILFMRSVFISLILLLAGYVYGQKGIAATGGNTSGPEGSVSHAAGQVAYITTKETPGSVTPGVQQPYEISVVTGEEEFYISLGMIIYPKPASDIIKLKIDETESENVRYRLYDIYGNLYQNRKIETDETDIPMSNYISGTYFLKVIQNNKLLKVFKVIKK